MTELPANYDKTDPGVTPQSPPAQPPAGGPQPSTGLSPEKRKQIYLLGGAGALLIIFWLISLFHHSTKQTPPDLATQPVEISGKNKAPETTGLFFHQNTPKHGTTTASTEGATSEYDAQLQELQARLKLLQTRQAIKEAEASLSLPPTTANQDRTMMVDLTKSKTANNATTTATNTTSQPTSNNNDQNAAQPDLIATKEDENAPPKNTDFLKSGTFLDAVLVNELVTDNYTSPVLAMIDRAYYDPLTQKLLIPAGTRVLGKAEAVKYQTASRLAITFDTFQFPNGSTFHINPNEQALEGLGTFGAADSVNRHTARILLTAGLVGVLTGWNNSQIQGGSYETYSGTDMMRMQANESLSRTAEQMLSPFLNAMPTITVNAGHRLKIWITRDVALPEYSPSPLE
jgi:type IV secretion system protein VirB10